MSRYIDAEYLTDTIGAMIGYGTTPTDIWDMVGKAPSIDIVRCENCRKSHIDGKTTHYLWCTEWGRSTDTFGYCERGEREGE